MDSEDELFPIKRPISPEDEHAVVDDKDTERFIVARDGDHFMCMFVICVTFGIFNVVRQEWGR